MSKSSRMFFVAFGSFLLISGSLCSFAQPPDNPANMPPVVRSQAEPSTMGDVKNERSWGTQYGNYLSLPSASFVGRSSNATYDYVSSGYIYATGSDIYFMAPITIPQGAYLDGIRVYYYDNSANDLIVYLSRDYGDLTPSYVYLIDDWRSTGTPGYTSSYINVGETIIYGSSVDQSYVLWIGMPDPTTAMMFKGVRLYYHLQISPPPATASFSDVPTDHPFFQNIEALYAARITQGYGSTGTYGPDDYVTRGQMAAFISRALGLHW